jgi:hypothetical protein
MSIALKPKTEPNGNISPIFNLNNFYSAFDYASKADLLSYAHLYTSNVFKYITTFANGLNFTGSINGISDTVFGLVAYLPNIIFELSNVSYDSVNNSTNITGGSWFENSSINTNLNVGSSLNVDRILSQEMLSNTIQVNDLSCRNLKLNNRTFNEVVIYVYINSVSLPLIKSNLIINFNIQSITSLYFTLKNGYRLDLVDINDQILFSYTNTSSDFIYYQQIPYNTSMYKINIYNSLNIIIRKPNYKW